MGKTKFLAKMMILDQGDDFVFDTGKTSCFMYITIHEYNCVFNTKYLPMPIIM